MLQWRVTIKDSKGGDDDFIVAASGATGAIEKAKDFWRKQKSPGATVVLVDARRERETDGLPD